MVTKKITVKDMLKLMPEDQNVIVEFYAYGMHYADNVRDNLPTVKDCLENFRADLLRATVARVKESYQWNVDHGMGAITIQSELMN